MAAFLIYIEQKVKMPTIISARILEFHIRSKISHHVAPPISDNLVTELLARMLWGHRENHSRRYQASRQHYSKPLLGVRSAQENYTAGG